MEQDVAGCRGRRLADDHLLHRCRGRERLAVRADQEKNDDGAGQHQDVEGGETETAESGASNRNGDGFVVHGGLAMTRSGRVP